jgi:membrane protein
MAKQGSFVSAQKALQEAKRIGATWSGADLSMYGASAAYYTTFSIAPILLIAVSVASFFVGAHAAEGGITSQFRSTFGASGESFIRSIMQANVPHGTSVLLTIVGSVLVILGATGIFGALQSALDRIFAKLPDKKA